MSRASVSGGYREVIRIAMPLILGMASYTIMQFCDRIFLSRYSSVAIQAAMPAGILAHTFVCFFQTLAGYAGTFTAHYHGAGATVHGIQASVQGLWLSLLSYPLTLLCIPLGCYFMTISGHSPEVLAAEKTYFTIMMFGGLMAPLNAAAGGYFIGIGRTHVNFIGNLIGCTLNVFLNYAMIFGHWGFPEMGIAGAAYSTLISGFFCFFIQFFAIFFQTEVKDALRKVGLRLLKVEWRLMGRIFRFGSLSGFELLMELGSYALFMLLVGRMGDLALASSNIAFSINNLAFSPLLGFGMATSTVVSQCMGAKKTKEAERGGYTGLKLGLFYMALIGLTFILFPHQYFALFQPKNAVFSLEELYETGRVMMYLMAAWGLLDTISIIIGSALKGAGDTKFVMIYLTSVGWGIWLPISFILIWLGAGIIVLWVWMATFIGLLSIGYLVRWRRGKWKTIQLVASDPQMYRYLEQE